MTNGTVRLNGDRKDHVLVFNVTPKVDHRVAKVEAVEGFASWWCRGGRGGEGNNFRVRCGDLTAINK